MSTLLKNGSVYRNEQFQILDVLVDEETGITYGGSAEQATEVIDCTGLTILPGLIDPHVHLREPGNCAKETVRSGTDAAAHGGITTLFAMPNLNPVPDNLEHLAVEEEKIQQDSCICTIPIASITVGEKGEQLSDIEALATHTFLYSDDGVGVQSEEMMRQAMKRIHAVNGIVLAHCEDNREVAEGWRINAGPKAEELGLIGVNNMSEASEVIRNIQLVRETGCDLHICHVSTSESIEAIRQAKIEGLPVSAEATPHHLCLCEEDITSDSGKFRMNPPLRSKKDQEALIQAVKDGIVECIATDHAPHLEREKNCDLAHAANGITGLETSFPVIYTKLVESGILSLEECVKRMSTNAATRFKLKERGYACSDLAIFDLNTTYTVDPTEFVSLGKSTPFEGWQLKGRCVMTIQNNRIVYRRSGI